MEEVADGAARCRAVCPSVCPGHSLSDLAVPAYRIRYQIRLFTEVEGGHTARDVDTQVAPVAGARASLIVMEVGMLSPTHQ